MYRSKKSMGKQSQSNAQANSTQANPAPILPPPNPLPNPFQTHFPTNVLLRSTSLPSHHTSTSSLNHSSSAAPFLDSFGSSFDQSHFESFTSLLQPALSTRPTPQLPVSDPSLPISLPSISPQSPTPDSNVSENELDEYENKLFEEVEIVDKSGNIIRVEKMRAKDVHALKENEYILVHVDELFQPIKAAGGLCTRFMTLLLRQPSICALDASTFRDVRKYSGAKLVQELRAKFRLPCTPEMDTVILNKFSGKYRNVKYRLKEKLLKTAKAMIMENRKKEGVYVQDEEKQYTSEQLQQSLDNIEMPSGFTDYQWEKFKDNIRDDHAKEASKRGKAARKTQVHSHTTGSISYARKNDMITLQKKRKPSPIEFFEITHQRKNGSYVHKESEEFMETVSKMITQKANDLGINGPLDPDLQSRIHSEVWEDLMEDENARKPIGYGVGVTKTQVSKLSADLRRIRNDNSDVNDIHTLRKRVSVQDNQIKELRNILHTFMSQAQHFQVASNMYANMNADSTLLARMGLSELQGRAVEQDSNNEMTIPSPHIPSP